MSKIVLVAIGEYIAQLGYNLKNKLDNPDEMIVIEAYLDEAVESVRDLENEDIDVIIARGNSAEMIKAAFTTIPVVEISITDVEIMSAINLARQKVNKNNISIGYVGFSKTISQIKSFLDKLNLEIFIYEVKSMKDIDGQIKRAIEDKVDVIIGGHMGCCAAKKAGINSVLLESSEQSLEEAYKNARDIQNAVYIEKRKSKEISTILNSVSDAIISIDEFRNMTTFNTVAEKFIGCKASEAIGKNISDVCKHFDDKLLSQSFTEGKKLLERLLKLKVWTML